MRCCENCFSSNYIKSIIRSFSNNNSDCDFCGSVNVAACEPRELIELFRNVVELYITTDDAINADGDYIVIAVSSGLIHERLIADFPPQTFNENVHGSLERLLSAVFQDEIEDYRTLLTSPVVLRHIHQGNGFRETNELTTKWENFVEEIKRQNRFHISGKIDLDLLAKLFSQRERDYNAGKIFYRGRIGGKEAFAKNEMGNPPSHLAKSGRANPVGISYLYVADSVETTLYESRAAIYDYVSVGEFRLASRIKVVNLRNTRIFDAFYLAEEDKLLECLLYLPFVERLEEELSRPIRRADNELDYLPTQYLSEFIKSLGYDGVEYKSSLNPSGYNIAIFYPEKLECIRSYVHEVTNVRFTHGLVDVQPSQQLVATPPLPSANTPQPPT